MLVLASSAYLPPCIGRTCKCTETDVETDNEDGRGWGGASATLELQWNVVGEDEGSLLAKQVGVQTNSVLVIAQQTVMTLDVGQTYTLQVEAGAWTGFFTNNIERFATIATIQLKVQPIPPVVRIKLGNRNLQWGPLAKDQKRLILDASESWDPDSRSSDLRLKYAWFLDCSSMFIRYYASNTIRTMSHTRVFFVSFIVFFLHCVLNRIFHPGNIKYIPYTVCLFFSGYLSISRIGIRSIVKVIYKPVRERLWA